MDKTKKVTEKKWSITTNRFVAVIDIMGFKDMVAKLPHEQIYNIMKSIDDSKIRISNVFGHKKGQVLVRTTTYSDSIMLYSKDGSYQSFE
ncbi:MAG: hypothetical protein LBH22_07290, partial [Bacteroidales bacterium]|nr:hypothetical protein [Bacteroidales bacterium]